MKGAGSSLLTNFVGVGVDAGGAIGAAFGADDTAGGVGGATGEETLGGTDLTGAGCGAAGLGGGSGGETFFWGGAWMGDTFGFGFGEGEGFADEGELGWGGGAGDVCISSRAFRKRRLFSSSEIESPCCAVPGRDCKKKRSARVVLGVKREDTARH